MNRALKFILSLLVTAVFSGWAFHGTDWAQLWASLKAANYLWLLPYMGIWMVIHLCRTLRWGCLLSGIQKVPFRPLNEASGIGIMMLIVLPFRLGEFARPFLIAQRSSIRKSAAMTTVVLERITDGICVAVLLRVLLFFVPENAPKLGLVRFAGNLMFALFGGGLAFLLFALWHQKQAVALVRGTLGRLVPRAAEQAAGVVDTFVGAMRQLPSPGQIVLFLFLTAAFWGLNGWGMSLVSHAFGCAPEELACTPMALTHFQGFMVMCVLVVGVMIPSAPGMVGTFQAAILIGVGLFLPAALVKTQGLAYASVVWLCQTVAQVGTGLVLMAVSHVSFRDLAGNLATENAAAAPEVPDGLA